MVLRGQVIVGLDDLRLTSESQRASVGQGRLNETCCCASNRLQLWLKLWMPHALAWGLLGSWWWARGALGRCSLPAHLVQVCVQVLKDEVDVLEIPGAGRQHDVLDFHNVCSGGGQHTMHSDFRGRCMASLAQRRAPEPPALQDRSLKAP